MHSSHQRTGKETLRPHKTTATPSAREPCLRGRVEQVAGALHKAILAVAQESTMGNRAMEVTGDSTSAMTPYCDVKPADLQKQVEALPRDRRKRLWSLDSRLYGVLCSFLDARHHLQLLAVSKRVAVVAGHPHSWTHVHAGTLPSLQSEFSRIPRCSRANSHLCQRHPCFWVG